jgi:hypothetical protein
MAFENLLEQKCNIFHLTKIENDLEYGLKAATKYGYNEEPDEVEIPCHFSVGLGGSNVMAQQEPQNEISGRVKLTLPVGTAIRLNDKVLDLSSGLEYIAEQPRQIRKHHIIVTVQRVTELKPI